MAVTQIPVTDLKDFESGSNANGSYQKFPNGMMIASHSLSVQGPDVTGGSTVYYSSSAATWTYPVPFVGIPAVSVGHDSGAADMWGGGRSSANNNTLVSLYGGRQRTSSYTVRVSAVGRWK